MSRLQRVEAVVGAGEQMPVRRQCRGDPRVTKLGGDVERVGASVDEPRSACVPTTEALAVRIEYELEPTHRRTLRIRSRGLSSNSRPELVHTSRVGTHRRTVAELLGLR